MNYQSFINIAKAIADHAPDWKKSRHVSLIVSGKSIVAVGENGHKTHTLAKQIGYRFDHVHSELDAFSKVRYRNGRMVLLNFRFNRQGDMRCAKPCKHCMPWCIEFFDEIWYTTNDGKLVKL